ncbi:MAG: hypothetical protein GX230_08000 [Lentisphaerae bacterium]|nr:hypothetical protein [Lentisphaerota bacterium]
MEAQAAEKGGENALIRECRYRSGARRTATDGGLGETRPTAVVLKAHRN